VSYIGVQPTAGQYRQLDDISGSFNGATVTFTTSVGGLNVTAGSAEQLLVSLGGVIQNPGTDYGVNTNSITFTTAPASGLDFFAILMGDAINIGTPADGSVTGTKLAQPFIGNIVLDTGTGTKIGTGTSQKLGFYNATPIIQPTTGVAEAAFVENSGGTAVNVDPTFGGYTIQQVVQALQNLGLLA